MFTYLFKSVYEPSDDTFLLCDAIKNDIEHVSALKPAIVWELGTGSGCVITFISQLLKPSALFLATDINPAALTLATRTAAHNAQRIEAVRMDLDSAFMLDGKVDVLIFNPPYVPTEDDEVGTSCGISASWAGGEDGRRVIDRFLPIVPRVLRSGGGVCYLLLVQENRPKDIMALMRAQGMQVDIIINRQAQNEHLLVIRIIKP